MTEKVENKTKQNGNKKSQKTQADYFFGELCYREYDAARQEVNRLYQRVSFVLALLALLGTITFNLGRIDILRQAIRIDVFLYYVFTLSSFSCLAVSTYFAVRFSLPRKGKYETLAGMDAWQKWEKDYKAYLENTKQNNSSGDVLLSEITTKLAEAQAKNSPINEERRQYFHKCVFMAAIGMISVACQAVFYLILKLQGI